jgi:hypothetical protein
MVQAVLELQGKAVGLSAGCPDHGRELKGGKWRGRKSTVLRGTQLGIDGKEYLVFRCSEKNGHLFEAEPPSETMPSTWEAVQEWTYRERERQAGLKKHKETERGQQ